MRYKSVGFTLLEVALTLAVIAALAALGSAVLDMARRLRLEAIAEGVETEAQLERLRELGCERAQGFVYAAPMKAGEFIKFVNNALQAQPPVLFRDVKRA